MSILTVPQSPPPVKCPDRLARNVRIALHAGYNVHVRAATVLVNGIAVGREFFEDRHPVVLLALLDKHIGRPGSREV